MAAPTLPTSARRLPAIRRRTRRATAASSPRTPKAANPRSDRNWNDVPTGIVRQIPGLSGTTSSRLPSRRHISPRPARMYQISSTVRCRPARDTAPAGSRKCAALPEGRESNSRTCDPSGAVTSGSNGEFPRSESRRSSLPWHAACSLCVGEIVTRPLTHGKGPFQPLFLEVRIQSGLRMSSESPGLSRWEGSVPRYAWMNRPSPFVRSRMLVRPIGRRAIHVGGFRDRPRTGLQQVRNAPGDGTWLPSAETRRGSVRTGSARPHERRAPGEWNADRIGATRGSGTSGSP